MILAYLDSLERALSFDRALARRIRQEAEVHLLEAISADPAAHSFEAQRKAIARFGEPEEIARQFAKVCLVRQARGIAGTVVLIVFGIFIAMKVRVEWYAFTHWTVQMERKVIADVVLSVDRYAFWTAILLGVAVWLYMSRQRVSAGSRRSLRHIYSVSLIATGALAVSVVGDGVLTGFQLHGTELGSASIVPLLSLLSEIVAVSFLGIRVLFLMQRARTTSSLLAP